MTEAKTVKEIGKDYKEDVVVRRLNSTRNISVADNVIQIKGPTGLGIWGMIDFLRKLGYDLKMDAGYFKAHKKEREDVEVEVIL